MLIPSLLVALSLSAPPKPSAAALATQKKLAAECSGSEVTFPPATIIVFDSPKAAYDRFEAPDPKGEWQAPGTVRRTKEELFLVHADHTLVLASFDDVEAADEQEDSLDPQLHSVDLGERFLTLRFKMPTSEVPPLPTDREPTDAEREAHTSATLEASFEEWILVLVDRESGKILGARAFLGMAANRGDKPGQIAVLGDRVSFLDDLDEGPTLSLSDLKRCALLEEDADARAAGHIALARAAVKRAAKAKGDAARALWREASLHFDRGLGIRATDDNLRIERAAVLVERAKSDVLFSPYVDAATADLDFAAKYPEDVSPAHKAQAKRLREAIARLPKEPAVTP